MEFDPIDINLGAKKALAILRGSGVVGYTEPGEVIIFDVALADNDGISSYDGIEKLDLTVGNTYTVKMDSGSYSTVCKTTNAEGTEIRYLGNAAALGGDDTGESFTIASAQASIEGIAVAVADFANGTKCTIIDPMGRTIHPIDPKYLPGVCLPVVEITSAAYPDSGIVALSAEESTALTAAIESGTPCVIKFLTASDDSCSLCCNSVSGAFFIGSIAAQNYAFQTDGTSWVMGEG